MKRICHEWDKHICLHWLSMDSRSWQYEWRVIYNSKISLAWVLWVSTILLFYVIGGVKPRVIQTNKQVEKGNRTLVKPKVTMVCPSKQKGPTHLQKNYDLVSLDQTHLEKSLIFATNSICVAVWMNRCKTAPSGKKNSQNISKCTDYSW